MLEDEEFLEFLSHSEHKDDDYYISWQSQMSLICILYLMNKVNLISLTKILD